MPSRRTVLGTIGTAAVVGLAGCSGGGDEGTDDSGGPGSDTTDGNDATDNGSDNGGQSDDQNNGFDGNPEDVPGEEEAKATVDAYLLAVSNGSVELFRELVHPDSPLAGAFTDEEIRQTGQVLTYYYRNMEVTELDRENGQATVEFDLAIETANQREQRDSSQELRVDDGEWKIWLTAPPATGDGS